MITCILLNSFFQTKTHCGKHPTLFKKPNRMIQPFYFSQGETFYLDFILNDKITREVLARHCIIITYKGSNKTSNPRG